MPLSKITARVPALAEILNRFDPDQLPLDHAALAIAAPFVNEGASSSLRRLDQLAKRTQTLAGARSSREGQLAALREVLFLEEGFCGNAKDYYCPGNSFLPCVLESRKGIPLTLSLVMMEVGRRVGLNLQGVGLPCHFVTCFSDGVSERLFDPYHGGVERTREECVALVDTLSAGAARVHESHFQPISNYLLLMRMLCNLRMIYRRQSDRRNLSIVLAQSLLLTPSDPDLHFELAAIQSIEGDLHEAAHHLSQYAALSGGGSETNPIYEGISREIHRQLASLN